MLDLMIDRAVRTFFPPRSNAAGGCPLIYRDSLEVNYSLLWNYALLCKCSSTVAQDLLFRRYKHGLRNLQSS